LSRKSKAADTLRRAGERAASLAASEEAERYFAQAANLVDEPLVQAELHERAGVIAADAARSDEAQVHYQRAIELFEAEGATHPAARVSARLGDVKWRGGKIDGAIERAERAFAGALRGRARRRLRGGRRPTRPAALVPRQCRPSVRSARDRSHAVGGVPAARDPGAGDELLRRDLDLPRPSRDRRGLFRHSLELALEYDLPTPALRVDNNLADRLVRGDRYEDALPAYESGIALARKVGNRVFESTLLQERSFALMLTGRWDEAMAMMAEIPEAHFAALPTPNIVPTEIGAASRTPSRRASRSTDSTAWRSSSARSRLCAPGS
jgi:tetratricopeptide (TPR) repeat protein